MTSLFRDMSQSKRIFEEVRQEQLRKERLREQLPDFIRDILITQQLKEKKNENSKGKYQKV